MKGKTYIITGATSGMGKSTALKLANEGASLILSGRDQERGASMVEEMKDRAGKAHFVSGDVGDMDYNAQLVQAALQNFGRLDGVVTNAGMLGLGAVTDLEPVAWEKTFQVNVHAVYYLLRLALPEIQKSQNGSVVINASIAAFKSFPNHPAYCASKAALVALTKQVALDYGPKVRVNAICPGPVDTPLIWDSAKAFPDPATAVQQAGHNTLLQRLGQPEDIANLVFFLLSEQASWITGSIYTIDGGALINS